MYKPKRVGGKLQSKVPRLYYITLYTYLGIILYIYIITFGGLELDGLKGSASARVMMFRWKGVCATLPPHGAVVGT